uniref:Uncharacterized protein n=1 Tax=Oryza sativa subsp. japonica TaxID=39947 RepID=Q7EYD3_ORYSJ|nr:hypothetical protein [Oryza sativa Japonica Group]BAD33536.1 hypothetical protein [Oryza sativa Japonica Group]
MREGDSKGDSEGDSSSDPNAAERCLVATGDSGILPTPPASARLRPLPRVCHI